MPEFTTVSVQEAQIRTIPGRQGTFIGVRSEERSNPDAGVRDVEEQATTFLHSSLECQRKSNIQMRMGTQRPGKILPS
jgi:hypothetical protein